MKTKTISQVLNRVAKLELSASQAHKGLAAAGYSIPMDAFLTQWDASKNKEGVINFRTLQHRLEGFTAGMAFATATATKKVANG